jgi:hypothetical protein
MQRIAVALIDALGFKGIWKRLEPSRVVNTLRGFRRLADEMTADVNQWPTSVSFHAQAISDSLIFATTTSDTSLEGAQQMVELLGVAVSGTLGAALLGDLPLAFRGHLAVGDGLLEDGILIGEAVDVAAAQYEKADLACVWLCPQARQVVESIDPKKRNAFWLSYDVPLVKEKLRCSETATVPTLAVNPLSFTPVRARHRELISRMQTAFDNGQKPSDATVQAKLAHTRDFLAACSSAAKDWWASQGFPNAHGC